jgi:hypothetical protein
MNDFEKKVQFDKKVKSAINEMMRKIGYRPSYLIKMISDDDSVVAVKSLLNGKTETYGFTTLFEKRRLDLSMENIVYSENWGDLFTEEEISIAKKRLKDYGYLPKTA